MRVLLLLALVLFAVPACSCGAGAHEPIDGGSDAFQSMDVGTDAPAADGGSDVGIDAPIACDDAALCDDGDPCNGVETCGASDLCVPGTPLADGTICRTGGKGATCFRSRCIPNP